MSISLTGANPLANTRTLANRALVSPSRGAGWVRNPSWLALTPPTVNDEKFVGLHAVWPDSNFLALSAAGDYTVDWGDGSATENFASGVVAYKEYDFADVDLANTNAPATFTASTNIVNRTAHGYSNGNRVSFFNIVTTTGLNEAQPYYVINATTNSFQVSETEGGTAVALTNDGSATLLPYKQVVVQVYPQAGQSLTQLNLHQKHNKTGLQAYASGFLDIAVAGANLTDIRIGVATPGLTTQNINFNLLESVNLVRTDCRQLERLFRECCSLQNVAGFATSTTAANLNTPVTFTGATNTVATTAHGFRDGDSVVFSIINITTGITVGTRYFIINANTDDFQVSTSYGGSAVALTTDGTGTAIRGTSMINMFNGCRSLTAVSLFNTSSVTTMNNMFLSCPSLTTVPAFDTSSVTNMNSMFSICPSLIAVPLFNTSSVTDMNSMFRNCASLIAVPLFNTSSVTDMNSMLFSCTSLTTVPLFNTSSVTDMNSMFSQCTSLTTVPAFNTSSVTTMRFMFSNCFSLISVPAFNLSSATDITLMFNSCQSLTSVPLFNTSSVTTMSNMFLSCTSLTTVPLFNTSSVTDMNSMFSGCTSLTTVPAFNTSSVTTMRFMFSSCFSLIAVPAFNLSSATDITNSFASCPSLSQIKATGFAVTFSVANCKLSSAALDVIYTNLATVSSGTITVTGNHGTDADDPTIATAKGWTVTG